MKASRGLVNRIMESLSWRLGLRVLRVVRRDMTKSPAPGATGITFRLLDRPQVMALTADPALDLPPAWAEEAVERAGGCTGAFRDGQPVAYSWFAYYTAPDRYGLEVRVPPGVAYRYKAFVRRECRGLHIARLLYQFTDRLCVEQGRETAVGLIAFHNAPSLAASTAIGAQVTGFIFSWRLFGRHVLLHSPGARRLGLRLVPEKPAGVPRSVGEQTTES